MKHCKTSDKPVSSNAKSSIAIQKKVAAKVCPFEKTIQGAEAEYTEALSNGTQLNLVKLAATRVYNESRRKADKALTERNYEAAVTGYLRPLRCVRPSHLMNEHRIVALYSGAAVACINLRKISDALDCFRRAASYLRVKKPCFVVQAQYLHMVLSGCLSYLRRRIQREEAEDILQSVRKKLRKYLNSNKPPRARLDESSFELHGEEITDQFVYLEDPSSEEATKWIKAQQEYSRSILSLFSAPPDIKTWSHEAGYSQTNQIPYRSGDYYIFRERKKGTNRLTVSRARKLTGKRTIILDEKSECAANEHLVSFRLYGDLMAYGKSVNGSDTSTWRVRDLKTGKDQENIAIQVHNGRVGFLPGGSGLWYRKSPGPNSSQPGSNTLRSSTKRDHQQIGIYFTALQGKEAGKERLYYKPNHRKSNFISPYFILENLVLISECYRRDSYLVFLRRQNPKSRKTVQLFKDCPGRYTLVGEVDGKLLFQTDATNSRGAVLSVKVDEKRLRVGKPQVVTQVEDGNTFIDSAHVVAGGILVNYTDIERGTSKLSLFDIDGRKIKDLKLPVEGIISGIIANRKVLSYTIESIGSSPRIFSHNVKTNRSKQLFDSSFRFPKELDISLVRVKSLDGTEIPMRLVRLRDTAPKGAATIMHVYGGFGVSQLPVLNHQAISWILMGGVWAQPYLRGGSEFGAHWHNQAIGVKKQRTFDDAIACARWLITHGYCKRSKLAIMGGSNGGLTVGAAICQAPELFGAAACYNGLFDMLKYESYGIGWIYADEYGSVKKKNDFQALKKYSPYHCLKETDHFPSVLLTASDHDDRVNPCHSYKFAALLQSKMGHKANILLNVESNRGHTGAIPSNLALDELLFIADALKLRLDK